MADAMDVEVGTSVTIKQDGENLPWVEKYRPSSLDQLIAHEEIISTIQNLVNANKLPHLLLYGPPGTGKTSTILAVAKTMYGQSYQNFVMELNASDERGIEVVRQQIKEFASTKKIFSSGFKLIILDEADQMTSEAQAALRRVIEKYTKNVRFCLICNYVNKIIPALQSRCTRFRFSPLKKKQIMDRLTNIARQENVNFTDDGLNAIIRLSGGDMRKCLNILQSCNLAFDEVNEENVYLCTGNPLPRDIQQIVTWMFNEPFKTAYQNILELKTTKSLALTDIIREVHHYALKIRVLNDDMKIFLLEKLADIEYRLAFGTSEKIQLSAMIGCFQIAKESIAMETPIKSLIAHAQYS